jgi:hypothetical protein
LPERLQSSLVVRTESLDTSYHKQEIRQKYVSRIMQSIEQQVKLYACSVNETADDTRDGGRYSINLLNCASKHGDNEFKTIGVAHTEATILTSRQNSSQNPDSILPRCLSHQQLIISIFPNTL